MYISILKDVLEIELVNPSQLKKLGMIILDAELLRFSLITGWEKNTSPPTPIYRKNVVLCAICDRVELQQPRDLRTVRQMLIDKYAHLLEGRLPAHIWYPELQELPERLLCLRLRLDSIGGGRVGAGREKYLGVTLNPQTGRSCFFQRF